MWGVDGLRGEELRAGVGDEQTEILGSVVAEGRSAEGARLFRLDRDDARYILTAPLSDGRVMSVVAPPFVESARPSALAPFVRGGRTDDLNPLSFIPLLEGDPRATEELLWVRTRTGWQSEALLRFQEDRAYHAHYALDLPNVLQATARATLLLALNMVLFAAFWLSGRGLLRDLIRPEVRLSGLVISFRSRVTLALFGFFALANALFGTVAYRTLAEASHRSARVIAERIADDAAGWYRALGGGMERLARQVNAELLEYRDGELREGSVEELVELGLYEGWTPLEIHELLDGREGLREFTERSVGGWEYVTAYRRLPDGDILGAQVPLEAGTEAIRSTDIIELLGFVIMVGAALSLALAMMAGRALTRPIQALQVASERVGSGNLALQLPSERTDEFGAVFRAFNRMVARVRRARRQLVRTSRRTQLIMEEAAVGMVALDPAGNVTLVNRRAEELLGQGVFVGPPIPNEGLLGQELTEWLGEYLEGTADRVDAELQTGERRLRLRARRLGSQGVRRGVVLAMDDVTDELRAERVLAWGEMARQVAHEVKNPLTPIKLSIQHVRRAWDDERPDFEEILVRNADAMLKEIDRLAGIAQSFSRFGAPGGDEPAPLAEVSVAQVVEDVMALYGGAAAPVRFDHAVESGLPTVVARPAELKEALVNLLENARVAGHEGGVVSIVARSGDERAVILEVVDDGAGIPRDVLPRIFEPKFSTRSTGAGLGLAIVQRLVLGWGGRIDVQSEVGRGTTVSLTLRGWISDEDRGVGERPPEATN
jgi:PAS domain S-box-containing protein